MNKIQIIAKNIGLLFISQIVNLILGIVYMICTARYLGVAEFGLLSFAIAFTGIFGVITDLGLNMLITREISRDKSLANKYFGNTIIIKRISKENKWIELNSDFCRSEFGYPFTAANVLFVGIYHKSM